MRSRSTASTMQALSVDSSCYQRADRIVPGPLNAKGGQENAKMAGVEVAPLAELCLRPPKPILAHILSCISLRFHS
jgi:hypothetical protein